MDQAIMWLYWKFSDHEVGYYDPNGRWHEVLRCKTFVEALQLVNYLNGGTGKKPPVKIEK